MNRFQTYFFYLTLFAAGAIILIIEIAGTRVLAPFYGSTIYVWSSLITVTLACLALGYFVGGKLADKKPSLKTLYGIIFLAGLATILIPKLDALVLLQSYKAGMIWGPLLATILLFSLPLLLLAMVTPLTVKLKTKVLDYLGSTAGNLYAISTVGSLIGALITGFWLIPNLGISTIINATAIALLLISLIWFLLDKKFSKLLFSLILLAILFVIPSYQPITETSSKIVYQTSSFYGNIQVVDRSGSRYLLINGISQTSQHKVGGDPGLAYPNDIVLARFLTSQEPKKALIIGLGAGAIPYKLDQFGIKSDIVEIDPKLEKIAIDFFDFSLDKHQLYIADARYFLLNTKNQYDLIVMDASIGAEIPFHLLSQESFKTINEKLTDSGVLVLNVTGIVNSDFIESVYATLKKVYPEVLVIGNVPDKWSNVIFFATSDLLPDVNQAITQRCENKDCIEVYQEIFTDDLVEVSISQKTKIITDDYNPTAFWQTKGNQAFRQWVWEFFGKDIFVS